MRIATLYRLHRGSAVATCLLLVGWLVTGLVITSGVFLGAPRPRSARLPVAWEQATVSPARVAATLETGQGRLGRLRLAAPAGHPVWAAGAVGDDRASVWISAVDGRPVSDPAGLAATAARSSLGTDAPVVSSARLARHDAGYEFGPLPVWRVRLGDPGETWAHVAVADGSVRWNRAGDRRKLAVERLHTLEALAIAAPGGELGLVGVLWLLSVATATAALLGLRLALPSRRPASRRLPRR